MQPTTTSTATRDKLIVEHAEIARRIALKMARRCPDWVAREDIVAAGMLGLTEAAARYDDSRKEPFLSFAEHRIRGAILDELRRGDLLPRRVRQVARKIGNAIRELENAGEQASDARVAMKLGVSVERYRNGLSHLVHVDVEPLDEKSLTMRTGLEIAPDEAASRTEEITRVKAALQLLEERDVTILGLHYIEDLTYQDIARTLGITPSRVCQLLWRAIERLRAHLGVTEVATEADVRPLRAHAA
ncbi:MAG: sigma-70 family RNA polymerase sigma factor [Myxococcales bacterium]|nr:sigma-70 family RNA polymerase sigma factor [Myxococcales bacterium]